MIYGELWKGDKGLNYCLIPLSSVTSAKRLERECLYNGVLCSVTGTPKGISKYGCSHSLRFKEADANKVVNIAETLGININGVYKEENKRFVRLEL